MQALKNYPWPGNVRELENAIERAFILSGEEIDLESLPTKVRSVAGADSAGSVEETALEAVEQRHILEILRSTNEDKVAAASLLGIDLSTLYRKLKRYEEQ